MIGYLSHHVINNEVAIAELIARDQRERLDHERLLLLGGCDAMVTKDDHRSIAGIAIENCELEWGFELTVPGCVVFELAEIALCHYFLNLVLLL